MAKTTVPQAHAERQILTPFDLIGSFDAEPLEHDSFEGSLERTARTTRIAHLMLSGSSRLKTPSSQHGAHLDLIEYVPWSNSLCLRRPIELHNASVPRPAPRPAPKPKPKPEPEPEPVPAGITDRLEHLRKRVRKQTDRTCRRRFAIRPSASGLGGRVMAEDPDFLDQISEALDQIKKAAVIIGVDRTTGAKTLFFSGDDPDGPVLHVPIDWHTREPAALIALCRGLKSRCDYEMSS